MNILVSGVADDIGFGVGRIFKDWDWQGRLHGIDIQSKHAALCVFDQCAVAPLATSDDYLEWISHYIKENNISVFIPTSESEIKRIMEEGIEELEGAKLLKSNNLTIMKALDKYSCLQFLSENGIKVPEHGIVGKHYPKYYPIIVKPRSGQGSKGIIRIDSENDLQVIQEKGFIWQAYLTPEDEEYTCAVFRSSTVSTRIIIFRRTLRDGFTNSGEVIENKEVYDYVESISNLLELNGVMNIQLRLTATGPLLFEINPRLSSTLVFREKLGFQDLHWWLADKLGMSTLEYVPPEAGICFFRGVQEYILTSA